MSYTKGPFCYRGQNTGMFEEQYRQYYSVYSIMAVPGPNMRGDTVLENVAENCTEGDARLFSATLDLLKAAQLALDALNTSYEGGYGIVKAVKALHALGNLKAAIAKAKGA